MGGHTFFGVQRPHDLIRAWRAALLLHVVGSVREGTLEGVWHAAGRDDREANKPSARAIADDIGSAQFSRARKTGFGYVTKSYRNGCYVLSTWSYRCSCK